MAIFPPRLLRVREGGQSELTACRSTLHQRHNVYVFTYVWYVMRMITVRDGQLTARIFTQICLMTASAADYKRRSLLRCAATNMVLGKCHVSLQIAHIILIIS
jgi:hypothetical protein